MNGADITLSHIIRISLSKMLGRNDEKALFKILLINAGYKKSLRINKNYTIIVLHTQDLKQF